MAKPILNYMDVFILLDRGYFPPDLPPPFFTSLFARKFSTIDAKWSTFRAGVEALPAPAHGVPHPKALLNRKFGESKWVNYSIPRHGYLRRLLAIPNPFHQSILSKTIADNWNDILAIFNKSDIGSSIPVENTTSSRAVDRKKNYGAYLDDCIVASFSDKYEVRTDISRFYPSLYTHVIPWAVHTKPIAKAHVGDDAFLGNRLDKEVRNGNSRQTFGIPVGPETSLILAELVTCTIDEQLQNYLKNKTTKILRYMDDYRIFAKSRGDAEAALSHLQRLLSDYELQINQNKTCLLEAPYALVDEWVCDLKSYDFSIDSKAPRPGQVSKQRTMLKSFVSSALNYARLYPDQWVPKFGFSYISNIYLYADNWNIYSSLILKLAPVEPSLLPQVGRLLLSERRRVNLSELKEFLFSILEEHAPKRHSAEVSWALWLCKEFKIKLRNSIAEEVFQMPDPISNLIALDLRASKLIDLKVGILHLEAQMTSDSLMEEQWLLTYEALNKGWVKVPKKNPINSNEYFKILRRHKVSFYDETNISKSGRIKSLTSDIIQIQRARQNNEY